MTSALLAVALAAAPAVQADAAPSVAPVQAPALPDVPLFDQDGKAVRLPELFRGRTVAVNFVFTTCSTVCSPLTATFARVQAELGARLGRDVHLVSITLDPGVDTPARLDAYARQFGRRDGWTFVTGRPDDVRRALRAFGAEVADKTTHPPMVLVGEEPSGRWRRLFGLAAPGRILEELAAVAPPRPAPAVSAEEAAARYFTDLEVVDQHGKTHRFFSDLVKGRKVLLHFAFSSCKTACPPAFGRLAQVQARLGDKLEREVRILTLSVDPTHDTPEALREVAASVGAKPGWYFLTGTKANVEAILGKLGAQTDDREAHSTALYLGDAATGSWVKTVAFREPAELVDAIEHLDDPLPGEQR